LFKELEEKLLKREFWRKEEYRKQM